MDENLQSLLIENGKKLTLSKVDSVDAFSTEILRLTVNGKRMTFSGSGIKIISFNKEMGDFKAEGEFKEIKFDGAKIPIIKRLFK